MSTQMQGIAETGLAYPKFVRLNSAGQFWNTSGTPAFENYNAANIANYGIAGTENGSTGTYLATDPSSSPGQYLFVAAGASLAVSDIATNLRWQNNVLNDVAATDIVTGGAIGTTSGKVNEVTLVDTLTTVPGASDSGTAQAGGASTITLRSGASASDSFYKDQVVVISAGTGAGQTNRIASYVGSTKVATVETAWVTQPDNTSVYSVIGRVG